MTDLDRLSPFAAMENMNMDENVSMTAVENRVEVAAIAMMNAERDVRGRHGLVFTDCRVLARLAIEAVDALSTAPSKKIIELPSKRTAMVLTGEGDIAWDALEAIGRLPALASIPTPTAGRAEGLEACLKVVRSYLRDTLLDGAVVFQATDNQTSLGKYIENTLALSSAPTHQAVTVDDALILEWAEELSIEANRADSGNGWILTATGIAARDQARKRLAILTAASPQRREDDAPRYSYARSSGVWAVWDRSTTTCIKQCADENEAEKLCNKLNAQRREE